MKYRTATLEGALLDAAVAKAEGHSFALEAGACVTVQSVERWFDQGGVKVRGGFEDQAEPFAPSSRWDHGGPIIERERINILDRAAYVAENDWRKLEVGAGSFAAFVGNPENIVSFTFAGYEGLEFGIAGLQIGPTPLTAAMRTHVAIKFGSEVEIP